MRWRRPVVLGLIGLVAFPTLVAVLTYGLLYATSPSCRLGPDAWGCQMTAYAFGLVTALPGAVAGVLAGFWWNRRRAA